MQVSNKKHLLFLKKKKQKDFHPFASPYAPGKLPKE